MLFMAARFFLKIISSLQVLATMFIAVSENLPKTSYIKMVDIWLIFNLMVPFFEAIPRPGKQLALSCFPQVILHTFIDSCRNDDDREINHHGEARKV